MQSRSWVTFWAWVRIYFKLLLARAPNKKEAAKAAGISEEKLEHNTHKVGAPFHKPVRRFFDMRPMPDFLLRFLDEVEKLHGPSSSPLPPPPPSPPTAPPPAAPRPRRLEPGTTVV